MAAKADAPDMVRLRNVNSGALVSVSAEKVERLGSEWEPVPAAKPAARTATKSTSK